MSAAPVLDVRRMRVLREVANRGTIAAAARALAYTPSAVSQQLATLEREAGVALLDRRGGRVALTEAGRRLVSRTEGILAELESAAAELAAARSAVAGNVHLGAFPSAEKALVAPALGRLRARHPQLAIRTTELEPEAALPALRHGDVDLAVVHEDVRRPHAPDPRVEREDLMEDPLLVVLAMDHPALADAVALTAVRAERWVATPPGTACRAMLDDACRAEGFVPDVPFHANDFAVLAAYAAEGLAVALIPALAAAGFGPEVAVRPVAGAGVRRRIYVAARRGTLANPAVRAVADALGEAALTAA